MKHILATILSLILLYSITFGQAQNENQSFKRIDTYLSELEKAGFNGSVLVGINDEPIISKGYGYIDKENNIKNTPSTLFDIGSITKQFTATAILKLEIQGKLSTQDKISLFFKDVPEDKELVTIHDLLRHNQGL